MNRRRFLASSAAFTGSVAFAREPDFELEEASLADLQAGMTHGQLTSERIVRLYLERIQNLDRSGPHLRSVLEENPEALAIARSLDEERRSKGARGPLHGVPVLLKDNIDTNDRLHTTAGSLALLDAPTPRDSRVAAKLRSAGAVILGKTNLSEWANFRSTQSTSGWSGRGGLTRNPYALDRNPCGSSSGSGVAVSANLSALAVGTETDGSIVCPSSMNGIVGIKPTLGMVSQDGIIPIAASQDTAGPMARTVRDAALLLAALSDTRVDFTSCFQPNGLRGARIGVARQYFTISPAVHKAMAEALDLLRQLGAELVDPVEFRHYEAWREAETTTLLYEFKAQLGGYLSKRGGPMKSLADVIAFNTAHRAAEMPYFEQELMEQAQEKGTLADKAYVDALERKRKLSQKQGIDELVKKHNLDALVGPTAAPAFVSDLISGDRIDSGCASPPAVAGYPHITVPAGHVSGLPVGLSFFGAAWTEPKLIQYAYAFEQARKARRKPEYLPAALL